MVWAVLLVSLAVSDAVGAPAGPKIPGNLGDASLEELMNVQVTSVSNKAEKLSRTPAAIYVITQEDIRRSGATTLPDLLRMVPGLDVAQIDTSTWAVSARGFNGRFANKLLVLVDGRSVYSELFSGTFWDAQNLILDDIERIEVIRGPGATTWGANAVNGVINIITKPAKETQGTLVSSAAGSSAGLRGFGEFQYGGPVGSKGYYRAFAKALDQGPAQTTNPIAAQSDWMGETGGFRMDLNLSPVDSLLMEGAVYGSSASREIDVVTPGPPFLSPKVGQAGTNGGSFMSRWHRHLSNGSEMGVQLSFSHASRDDLDVAPSENMTDLDFHYRMPVGERNSFVWGLGYRFTDLSIDQGFGVQLGAPHRQDSLFQGFIQDDLSLVPDRLTLTVGSKFEHNPFTGFEFQPGMRLAWTPEARQTLWVAVSRAVRTASIDDQGLFVAATAFPGPGGVPTVITLQGNPRERSEDLTSNELGYRIQATRRISFDLATFFNAYDYLVSQEPGQPYFAKTPSPGYLAVPIISDNLLNARSYGVETSVNAKPTDWWRLSTSYSWLKMVPTTDDESRDTTSVTILAHSSPQHQFQVRSYLDLPWHLEFDTAFYAVGSLPSADVPGYVRSDARLGWHANRALEVSITGQNLINGSHLEFFSPNEGINYPFLMRRSVYGRITWQF